MNQATLKKPTPTAGPPEDIDASDLWLALTTLPRPHRIVPMPRNIPGTDQPVGELAMWPLSQEEHHESNAFAEATVKGLLKESAKKDEANLGYQNLFANELAVQQLWRACRNPKNLERPAFPSPKAMRMRVTSDEIGVLYNHFLTTQVELGPIVTRLEEDEYEAWVRRLAEGGQAFPFDSLSWDLRTILVRTMASQLVAYWTVTSSAGSPPAGDTSSSDEARPSDSNVSAPPSDISAED